jgi:hypothetical protein
LSFRSAAEESASAFAVTVNEETILLLLTLFAYYHLHYSWFLFAILFLTPDLFMLGYLANVRLGAAIYNVAHTLTLPLALLFISYTRHWQLALAFAIIWTAHIAFDRVLGYGLKYPTYFKDTHLQHIAPSEPTLAR